jgi:amino acid adenylation domain-containing protein
MKEPIEGFLMSPQQARLWKLQGDTKATPFRTQCTTAIIGRVDKTILKAALQDMVERHEILRTTFHYVPDLMAPIQVIKEKIEGFFEEIDLSHFDEAEAQSQIDELFLAWKQSACDFQHGPLFKVCLFSMSDSRHSLLLSLPSICADAGTAQVLMEELGRLYEGRVNKLKFNDEPLQYVQFAELQNQLLKGEAGESGQDFWRGQNGSTIPPLKLPFQKKMSPSLSFQPESVLIRIESDVINRIEVVADKYGTSTEVVLMACWQILLWRLSGQPVIVTGFATEGRKYEELAFMPGLFSRNLPIVSRFKEDLGFECVLNEVERGIVEAHEYQEGFNYDGWGGENYSKLQFFPFCFEFDLLTEISVGEIKFSVKELYSCADQFDLRLHCKQMQSSLVAKFDFNPEIFDSAYIKDIAAYYKAILLSAISDPSSRIDRLEALDARTRHELLVLFNKTQIDYSVNPLVYRIFEQQVARTPNSVAVESDERQITYADLNDRANRLAKLLRQMGVGPESLVGIFMEHSPELIVSILSVFKAGGAYLPLDPSYPKERIAFMLSDAGASLVLTQENLRSELPENDIQAICLDSAYNFVAGQQTGNLSSEALPDNLAYVIYTSGSTGQPKGTMITHRGLGNYINWCLGAYEVERGEGAPLHSSIAFDLSITSLLAPLVAGRKIVLARKATGIEALYKALQTHEKFSFVKLTPAHARLLGQQLLAEEKQGRTRFLILGGEALLEQDIAYWQTYSPDTIIVNEYGPTETVVGCSVYKTPAREIKSNPIPIGRPIANTQLYILDRYLQPVPPGVTGELYIGGIGLARGYLHRPILTAEKFLPHPFSNEPGARLYRTGDLARFLKDGNIEFLGRIDNQVKIRGLRVELGEIESVLTQHCDVREAVVVTVQDELGGHKLVAYLVANRADTKSAMPSINDLRNFLEQKLPDYMIPSAYVMIEMLPLTANGKIDRNALPQPDQSFSLTGSMYVAPRTVEEEILAGIFSSVLGIERIGIDDKYFALGGNSIQSIQIIGQARDRGLSFTVDQLFKHQTIRRIVSDIRGVESESILSPTQLEPFDLLSYEDRLKMPEDAEDAYPLSKLQAGMVFHREFNPESAIYHDVFGYHVKAPLNLEALAMAIDQLINRHPVLRTSFDLAHYSEPLQLIHRKAPSPLTVEDIVHIPSNEQDAWLTRFLEEEKKCDFDYLRPPLLRFYVHIRSEQSFQFWISFHHAILDGWSDISLLVELALSYQYLLKGEPIPFQPPATRYRDFVALEKQAIESEVCRQFWMEELSESTSMQLPRWHSSKTDVKRSGGYILHSIPISDEVSEALQRLARQIAVPLKSVLLAAHMRVMSLLSGQRDVLTTMVSVGRPETKDGDKVLGLHLNSVPYRLSLQYGTWVDLIREAFEKERLSLPYRRFPMAELQRLCGRQRLSETLFYFTHYYIVHNLDQFPELEVYDWKGYEETSFTLSTHFSMNPLTSRLTASVDSSGGQIDEEQLSVIANYYSAALAAMASNPHGRYDEVCLLADQEQFRLLNEWNNAEVELPEADLCISQVFEKQAERTPSAVALAFKDVRLTYEELNGRANNLANFLRSQGVGPEVVVGLCVTRSPEMLIGILGILKAGGTYLPLDPAYPIDRLKFMLEDANVSLLLSQDRLRERLPQRKMQVVCLDSDWDIISRESSDNLINTASVGNSAYVIYTSGSTGQPKGVVVSHHALVNHAQALSQYYGLNSNDRVLQFAAIGFDVVAEEIFPSWQSGAAIVLWSGSAAETPEEFLQFVSNQRVTVLNLPTPYWHEIVSHLENTDSSLPACVRHMIVGSDTVSPQKLSAWKKIVGDAVRWTNLYGVTEATITATIYEAQSIEDNDASVSIGRPISNVEVYILDSQQNLAPIGVTGEVYIGGIGLARGYLNRADLTAERFIPSPFSKVPGARLYRTGDLARYLHDGNIEFQGRLDDQLKVRGFRIELREIESALELHPSVSETVVLAHNYHDEEKQVVAYIIPKRQPPPISDLRNFLKDKLPDYMIPAAFVLMESFPLTPSGKLDRKALPTPDGTRSDLESAFIAPRTVAEEIVARIWAQVIKIDRVGIGDNFFDLGGHSLLATQIVARVRDAFQTELPLSKLYENPTVEGIIDALADVRGSRETVEEIALILKEVEHLSADELKKLLSE